jgi:archaeosine-15-forming tRNA-guanine transglycosylase
MAGAEDGLTTMAVTGTLVYDATTAKSLRIVVNSDLAALP